MNHLLYYKEDYSEEVINNKNYINTIIHILPCWKITHNTRLVILSTMLLFVTHSKPAGIITLKF